MKPYQAALPELPGLKPAVDHKKPDSHPFRELEQLMGEITEVRSRDFVSMKYEYEEKQKYYSSLFPPNFEL